MKRYLFLSSILLLVFSLSFTAFATEREVVTEGISASVTEELKEEYKEPLLSPAILHFAAKKTLLKSGVVGENVAITVADFAKVLGYTPSEVTIASLPARSVGSLCLGSLTILEGQTLSASTLDKLVFVPNDKTVPVSASFTFTAMGKAYETNVALSASVFVLAEKNEAPSASHDALTTYADVPVFSAIRATDPEQDALTFTLVRAPKKGVVTLDAVSGTFVYTPNAKEKGEDVFTYRVSDQYGNESELCKIKVKIKKAKASDYYDDLSDHWAASAAMQCSAAGILSGEKVGDQQLFYPAKEISRAEFLVAAMQAAEVKVTQGYDLGVFADAKDIPEYARSYVSTAYKMGVASGTVIENKVCFSPNSAITRAEAAVILNRLLGIETPDVASVFSDADFIPTWSINAMYALHSAGILTGSANESSGMGELRPADTLDRAQAAQILARVLNHS